MYKVLGDTDTRNILYALGRLVNADWAHNNNPLFLTTAMSD